MPIAELTKKFALVPYKSICFGLILAKTLFSGYLDYRQYKRLSQNRPIPSELKELAINEEEYNKSRKYSKEKLGFGIFEHLLEVALECTLLMINYWAWLWAYSGSVLTDIGYDPNNEYTRGIIFLLFEMLRGTLWELPFNVYSQFVIEEKYGFNKNTPRQFTKDLLISLALKTVFMPLIMFIIVWVINWGGEYFYVYVEIAIIIIVFIAMWLYPNVIAPLFNKFTEVDDEGIRQALHALAGSVNYPLKKIYSIDASRRSAHSNAYLFGIGNNKMIVLYDTLIKQLNPIQIEAVMCHELGHWKYWHTVKNLVSTFLQIFLMFYLYGFFMTEQEIFLSFGFKDSSIFIGLALYTQIYTPISFICEIITLRMIRKYEFEADKFAHEMGRGDHLQDGLKKMFKENLGDMDPDPVYSAFNHTHPTLLERVKYLRQLKDSDKKTK